MKKSKIFLLAVLFLAMFSCENKSPESENEEKPAEQLREFYQLKVYTFDTEEQVATTDQFLKDAFLPGLKKLGISQVGVFKPRTDAGDTIKKTYVLIPLTSIEQLVTIDDVLSNDSTYLISGADYINAAFDQKPYSRIESILLRAFPDMPSMKTPALDGPRSERIYELRSYESPTEALYKNKVDMFNAGGEVKLFDKLQFNAVFYAEVISGSKMPNLMYMTTFSDQESHDRHWDAFRDAPEWIELVAMAKYQNNVSHADIMLLYPTDYSDY